MPARKTEDDPMLTLADAVLAMTPADLERWVGSLTDTDDVEMVERIVAGQKPGTLWKPHPHQIPPTGDDWYLWLLLAGRGAGKTDACAAEVNAHAEGPPCLPGPVPHRIAIVAPTLGDASKACVNGPSGLKAHNPGVREVTRKGGTFAIWPNGSEGLLFGTDKPSDVDRLRAGGNTCHAWCEEMAAWRYLRSAWDHLRFGLRVGKHPKVVASTTPRNRPHLLALMKAPNTVVTRAKTSDNPNLPAQVRADLYDTYGGTRLGRQELDGEVLEAVEGALFTEELIEAHRVEPGAQPSMRRIVVAVDPSWGTTHDECGIVVAGQGIDGRCYVLDDLSLRATPAAWGAAVADAYLKWEADRIIAETNFGAETVKMTMRTVERDRKRLFPFKEVKASRGKAIRAEPVQGLYEQGKVHHVGRFGLLEFQMCVAAGTQVLTERGSVAVETVTTADRVWTRSGWRQVEWSGQTGDRAEMVTIETASGAVLRCTPDHRVWVEGVGFIPAARITRGDRVNECPDPSFAHTSSSAASSSSSTRAAVATTERRSRRRARPTSPTSYTAPSGSQHMALSLPSGTSTTPTTTEPTTTSPTSGHSAPEITSWSTAPLALPSGPQANGPTRHAPCGPPERPALSSALGAVRSSNPSGCGPCSVPSRVVAVTTTRSAATEPVYDLTVEGAHEFFANGVLVHNCNWVPPDAGGVDQTEQVTDDAEGSDWSPDRLDAAVWAVTELMLGSGGPASVTATTGSRPEPRAGQAPATVAPRTRASVTSLRSMQRGRRPTR